MNRVRSVLALSVLSLATMLTGCSDQDDEPKKTEGPAATSSPEPTESSTTEPAEPEVDPHAFENRDPCSVVPDNVWKQLVPKAKRADARPQPMLMRIPLSTFDVLGSRDELPKYGCEVLVDPGTDREEVQAAWGWYIGSVDAAKLVKEGVGGTEHNEGTYLAVTTIDFLEIRGVGLDPPDNSFWVTARSNTIEGSLTRNDPQMVTRAKRTLRDVLGFLSLRDEDQPRVLLPEGCPGVNDPRVRKVIGTARFARGTDDGEGTRVCLYRNAEERTVLRLTSGVLTDKGLSELRGFRGHKRDRFTGPDGARGQAITTDSGLASGSLFHAETGDYVFASVEPDYFERDAPSVPRAALIRLMTQSYADQTG